MTAHEVFTALGMIAYAVFFALSLYAIRSKKATPMLVALVISSFFNLMISLTK